MPNIIDTTFKQYSGPSLFDLVIDRQGWSDDYLRDINSTIDYPLLENDLLADTLHKIYENQDDIVVLPDFDMDGISSGIMLYAGLAELGFKSHIIVPDYNRGHDLDPQYVDDILGRIPDTKAIITTDSGVNSLAIAQRAKEKGIQFLITDHHIQEGVNDFADVIVNPNRIDESYPFKGICGAMVALEVLRNYTKTYQPLKYYDIDMLRVFAGIGTVADVMPILYNNRKIVRDSISFMKLLYVEPEDNDDSDDDSSNIVPEDDSTLLELINMNPHSDAYINAFKGLEQLIYTFSKKGKLRSIDDISETFYGFYVAPSFNSARRVNGDINPAFLIFTTSDKTKRAEYAEYIFDINESRKNLVKQYTEDLEQINELVYHSEAPAGVLGLLANTISKETGLPAIVINKYHNFAGSGRSPEWYPLRSAVADLGGFAQGHEYACGIRFPSENGLKDISQQIIQDVTNKYNQLIQENYFQDSDVTLGYDADVDWDLQDEQTLFDTIRSLNTLRPFGHEFPEPTFNIRINLNECSLTLIGKERNHIRITTKSGIKLLWWNAEDKWLDLLDAKQSPILSDNIKTFKTKLAINEFMGSESVNAIIDKLV